MTAGAVYAEAAEQTEPKKQTVCPVMGSKVGTDQYVDVKGYRIYICCKGCAKVIEAEPDTFIAKMQAEGIELEKAPSK
jgi:hypothetical protein